jgi:hypothetical protein
MLYKHGTNPEHNPELEHNYNFDLKEPESKDRLTDRELGIFLCVIEGGLDNFYNMHIKHPEANWLEFWDLLFKAKSKIMRLIDNNKRV